MEKSKTFKMKYETLSKIEFTAAMNKLLSAPVHGSIGHKIVQMNSELKKLRKKISEEYIEKIINVFGEKGEDGKVNVEEFKPAEGKEEELNKAQEEFSQQEIDIEVPMLTSAHISHVSFSPKELDAISAVADITGFEEPSEVAAPAFPGKLKKVR